MDDLQILTDRGHRTLMRSARTGAALFGSGVIVGLVIALVFATIIKAAILVAAIVIVLIAVGRMLLGRKRY